MRTLEGRYARALFEVLRDEGGLKADVEQLTGSKELWNALTNPCVRVKEKEALLEQLEVGNSSPALRNFYRVLCRRERLGLLPGILAQYHALCLEAENAAEGELRCARPMAREETERLSRALCRIHGKSRIDLRVEVDPSLLGGFVLKLGDVTYDKSVRGMLNGLRRSLKER